MFPLLALTKTCVTHERISVLQKENISIQIGYSHWSDTGCPFARYHNLIVRFSCHVVAIAANALPPISPISSIKPKRVRGHANHIAPSSQSSRKTSLSSPPPSSNYGNTDNWPLCPPYLSILCRSAPAIKHEPTGIRRNCELSIGAVQKTGRARVPGCRDVGRNIVSPGGLHLKGPNGTGYWASLQGV